MEVRRILSDEWRTFRELRLRALQDAPDAFGSTYAQESANADEEWIRWVSQLAGVGGSFGVVAVEGDTRWIGLAVGAPHRDHPGQAGLFAMWVDPSARGTGVGTALVESVVGWARSAGFPVLRLQVTASNDAAIRLYERCGFTDEGRRIPLRDGSDVVSMTMTKAL